MALDTKRHTHSGPALIHQEDSEINLSDILDNLIEYRTVFGAVAATCLAVALGYAVIATPVYTADALIQVEEKKGSALGALSSVGDMLNVQNSPVLGEIEILRSRNVIGRAVEAQLAHIDIEVDNRFPIIGNWLARKLSPGSDGLVTPPLGLDGFAWGGEELQFSEFEVPDHLLGQALQLEVGAKNSWRLKDDDGSVLLSGIAGQQIRNTNGRLRVAIKTLRARAGTVFTITRFSLLSRIEQIEKQLNTAETKRQSSIIGLSFEDTDPQRAARMLNAVADAYLQLNVERRSEEAEKTLNFLKAKLPELRARLEESENALNSFRARENTIDVTGEIKVLLDKSVALEKERVQAELQRSQQAASYQPQSPVMRALDSQINNLKAEENRLSNEIRNLPRVQQDYLRLVRDVEVNNQLYVGLLNNAQQLQVAKAGTVGNVAIIDRAVVPERASRPKRKQIVTVGGMGGLLLGFLAAQALALLKARVRDPKKLEQATRLSSYAILPQAQDQLEHEKGNKANHPYVLAAEHPTSPSVEALRSLRLALQFGLAETERGKVILITSAIPGQGKSFISANVAYLLASSGKNTLLIDADVRRSSIGRYLPTLGGTGLTDVLLGKSTIEASLRLDVMPNLTLLSAGPSVRNPGELLASANLPHIINNLAERFDYVIIDSPPLLPVMDAALLAKLADVTAFVVRQGRVSMGEVKEAIDILAQAGEKVDGMIFNGFVASRVRYGYGGRYGSHRYGSYGQEQAPNTDHDEKVS